MGVRGARFGSQLDRFKTVALDSSILVYHLEDVEPYSELTEIAFSRIAAGSPAAVLSPISVTELLAKPFGGNQPERVAAFEQFVLSVPNASLMPVNYPIAKQAGRLRGTYGIRTPDALLLGTALEAKADAFLTNDLRLRKVKAEGIEIVVLEDYV